MRCDAEAPFTLITKVTEVSSSTMALSVALTADERPLCQRSCRSDRAARRTGVRARPLHAVDRQEELGWDDARRESEAQAYLTLWRTHYSPPPARIPAHPPEGEVLGQSVPEPPSGLETLERDETSH